MTHSASSAEAFTEEGWLAKKKKVLQEGKFFDLLKMVTRGNSNVTTTTEDRSRRQKIEYHEIVPGQLKIGNTLGSGATGIVYEGTYFEQAVAVKKLHPHIAAELSAIEEFIQEAEIWKPLTFRNVLQLYGVCADPGNVCMVMEIGAMSLSDLLYKEVQYPDLPWSRRLNIARDVAAGCLYLHSKGIVHRDIKSMNILLSQEGIVKICDFGMSKTLGEIEDEHGAANADQVMGTPQWLAPEVADGEAYTKAADVYSFGIVLWEIGSRRLPYSTTPRLEEMQPPALLAEVAKGVRPNVQSLQHSTNPQVDDRFVMLMTKCWAPVLERPSFEYVLSELTEILDLEERRDRNKLRDAELAMAKGNEHFNKREYELAIGCLKKGLLCVPQISGYMCYWLCCMSLKQTEDALAVCAKWSKDFPFCTAAWVKKGDTLMYLQKYPEALTAYQTGQSFDPYDTAVKNKIKDCQKNVAEQASQAPPSVAARVIDFDSSIVVAKKLVHRETLYKRSPPPRQAPRPGEQFPPRLALGGRALAIEGGMKMPPRLPPNNNGSNSGNNSNSSNGINNPNTNNPNNRMKDIPLRPSPSSPSLPTHPSSSSSPVPAASASAVHHCSPAGNSHHASGSAGAPMGRWPPVSITPSTAGATSSTVYPAASSSSAASAATTPTPRPSALELQAALKARTPPLPITTSTTSSQTTAPTTSSQPPGKRVTEVKATGYIR